MHRLEAARPSRFRGTRFRSTTVASAAVALALSACVAPATLLAQETEQVDFLKHVQPILAKRCFACHGPDKAEGGLRFTNRDAAFAPLESGEHAIVAGAPDKSEMLARVAATHESGERMPPEGDALSAGQIDVLKRWIEQGAKWADHFAFRPVQDPPVPAVAKREWVKTPIDAFVLAKLEEKGIAPNPPAARVAWLRRATYDLTGLPPTPAEVEEFVNDASPDAYEKVVDRLLASPRYGEHWGRHWLDVVRFAETNSFERDGAKPNAWRFRDYVIKSFNDDKPYDQFVREQLAGDELPEVTTDSIVATGYYRLGLWDDEPADREQALFDEFDDIVATTGQAFLGLTVNCARCHDHKIDPIPQTEYYSFLSFFRDIPQYRDNGATQYDISPPDLKAKYAELEGKIDGLKKEMHEIEQRGIAKMPGVDQRKTEGRERDEVLKEKLQAHLDETEWGHYAQLRERRQKLEGELKKLPGREMALAVARTKREADKTFVLFRGNPHSPTTEVEPVFPGIFQAKKPVFPDRGRDAKSPGRRLVLADWIASPDNMLTSRVMVNRVWQHHFGRGIVRSTNNFGQLGDPPTHPELLDWLAKRFVEGGWKLKPIHKMIMLSAAYQTSSAGRDEALAKDPANDLFWRVDMRRLSAEEIRDSIYAVNGTANYKMFGPSIYPTLSEEVLASQSQPGNGWGKSSPEEQARRSVYIYVKRSLLTPLLSAFDFPDPDTSCEARFQTTQPAQALAMINGAFINEQAHKLAERLKKEAGDDPRAQISLAYRLALGRPANDDEVTRGAALLEKLRNERKLTADRALDYYCLVVLSLNEFLYVE